MLVAIELKVAVLHFESVVNPSLVSVVVPELVGAVDCDVADILGKSLIQNFKICSSFAGPASLESAGGSVQIISLEVAVGTFKEPSTPVIVHGVCLVYIV